MANKIILLIGMISAQAFATGYLEDFDYQVSQFKNVSEAQSLMNAMSTDTRSRSICSNRAHFWAYDLFRKRQVKTGKVFIHFTKLGQADEDDEWAYHVAPYVIVAGEEMVLDPAFPDAFHQKPVSLSMWTKYFGKSENCVVLDPVHHPKHLEYEQNNMPNDVVTPLTYKKGAARQYPYDEGICYIRKVPMQYKLPLEVYGADLYHADLDKNKDYKKFEYASFDSESVIEACGQAMNLGFKFRHSCTDYLGF